MFFVQAWDSRNKKRVTFFPLVYGLATFSWFWTTPKKKTNFFCLWMYVLFLAVNVIHCLPQELEPFFLLPRFLQFHC